MNDTPQRKLGRPGVTPEEECVQLSDAFHLAWDRTPRLRCEYWLTFADRPTRLRVVGKGLASAVMRAFAHLESTASGEDPCLTIDLWDGRETGVHVEGLVPGEDLNAQGETFVSGDGAVVITARTQTRTAFDRKHRRIVGWIGAHEQLTQYELGRPLHTELMLWHKDRDVQAVHSGLVARNGNGILFGGPGGSGKSTTALTCLMAGFEYMADDYVGLESKPDGTYVGHSLYCSTHLEPEHLERFPELRRYALPGLLPREDKSLVLLSDLSPGGLSRKARIRAVALPILSDAIETRIREASKVESLLRLAPSSLLMLPYAGIAAQEFEKLSRFLQSVPTYWLELGRDLEQIPRRVGEILERHS